MDLTLTIGDSDFREEIDIAIKKAIREHIEPKVSEYLKEVINDETVARIIEGRIRDTVSYSAYGNTRDMSISGLFEKRIIEISKNITDKELKDFLFEAIFSRVTNK